ncbi:PHD-finger domain-containing protein [Colletotrichum higginsianum IMI 349063]|uniref:PHD-finger domain-containing protein n=2 Tax=Colletotrichum higginsianum TaxID=80884 RepID=A0A1B7YPM3_COLHI|nr:PHD-finger domain-containing protein [Colletotrichum higginsianum IMI 349063]OBR13996.1 PHD-finger domain-containing protein [Colletotrichum higginsianum IMI 349063]
MTQSPQTHQKDTKFTTRVSSNMPSKPSTPRRAATGRKRGRPPGTTNAARIAREVGDSPAPPSGRSTRDHATPSAAPQTEPPPKRRRYIPGGAGGGGRFIDDDGTQTPMTVRRQPREPRSVSAIVPRRERSARLRTAIDRDDMEFSSAAAVAAAVAENEGYKPREERGWEEFHPKLDIDATFMIFRSEEVDGISLPVVKSPPRTPAAARPSTPMNGSNTPLREMNPSSTGNTPVPTTNSYFALPLVGSESPQKRRTRPPRESVSFLHRDLAPVSTPRVPQVLPIRNQTPKERLDLKAPSYRRSDQVEQFESKSFGQARYVDKSMMNVGYQETDRYIQPESTLIKAAEPNLEEDLELAVVKADGDTVPPSGTNVGRVEYDMDEQDDQWLEVYNKEQRRSNELEPITREVFEIAITKIEKEWHALEKRIPKPNPKPPQTHRPRSSSAAAVNGEPQVGEEQDSKCAICDDGDCENTNAIVFCDGCDLAVHQECYGVPFIPEGQWLCRKCQLIGRGVPTCIFCPNTDGAFKQTNSSKWAHLLCAMWIPEVSLGNATFMEPVMDVEKVPKTRWKLSCYICNQKMGACIQCSNKSCYQAFHVTCARRSRLFLKMKNSHGALAVLDSNTVLKAFCDKHCPPDYAKDNGVAQAAREAKKFYKRAMKGRIWADSQATAHALAANHRHALTEHPPDESQMTGAKFASYVGGDKKKGQPGKQIWKLPSGAPIIPQAVFDIVEQALSRFPFRKRKDFVGEACRYWTLKREARRGAALLKRLQLQMETFSSMELTRRNFAQMGPSGKSRLARRVEFAEMLLKDLWELKLLSESVVEREQEKLDAAELEQEFVDTCYFPIAKLLVPVIEKAIFLDKHIFKEGLLGLQEKLERRFYTNILVFTHDLCEVINVGINTEPQHIEGASQGAVLSPVKQNFHDPRQRKALGKRILKAVQPQLEAALRTEAEITHKPYDTLAKELEGMLEASIEFRQPSITVSCTEESTEPSQDTIMVDAANEQITVANDEGAQAEEEPTAHGDEMDVDAEGEDDDEGNIEVNTSTLEKPGDVHSSSSSIAGHEGNGKAAVKTESPLASVQPSDTPPETDGYVTVTRPTQPAPPTPPQSNGSLGNESTDPLSEGGVPWYFSDFKPKGTTVVEEQWTGREAIRSLSEDLTDMDDQELEGLAFDVEDSTITASPTVNDEIVADTIVSKAQTSTKVRKRTSARSSTRRR